MPNYDFEDTKTGKQFTEFMSIADREVYLKENPHIRQLIGKINIVSGTGGLKNDGGWNDNIQRIAEAHPQSQLARQKLRRTTKQVKTQQVIEKHRKRRGK